MDESTRSRSESPYTFAPHKTRARLSPRSATRSSATHSSVEVETPARLQTVLEILREGKDVAQLRDETGRTPLHMAAEGGDLDLIDMLIQQYGASIAAETHDRNTALHLAAMKGQTDSIEALLKRGADVTAENGEGLNPLDVALKEQRLEDGDRDGSALMLLKKMTEQQVLQQRDRLELPLLWRAAMRGYVRTTDWILQHRTMRAAQLLSEPLHGRTLLFEALANQHQEVVQLLVKRSACVQGVSSTGRTGLHYAASAGMLGVVKHLLRTDRHHEPPPSKALNMYNSEGRTPLESACYSCEFDQDSGDTRQDEYRDTISLLLEKSDPSLPTAEDTREWTALHWAAHYKRPDLIRILVSRGADVEAQDFKQRKPADIAKSLAPCAKVTGIMEWLQPDNIKIRGREVHAEHRLTRPRPVDDDGPLLWQIPVYLAAVYRGGSCQTSRFSVHSVLYECGPRTLLKEMERQGGSHWGRSRRGRGDLALQWIHLPANNVGSVCSLMIIDPAC